MNGMRGAWLGAVMVLLGGCASSLPPALRQAPADNPSLAAVRADPGRYLERMVRWGGTIARVENRDGGTRVEVVARTLFSWGEPVDDDASPGRFVADVAAFLDPAVYAEGRGFTVSGTLAGTRSGRIGEMSYRYPVVKVEQYHLWPERPARCETCDPYFMDPWWPYGYPYAYPYPYYRRR